MLTLLKRLLLFRMGQKATRGFARTIGLRKIAPIVGLIGGIRYLRRHV